MPDKHITKIIQYLEGALKSEERKAFEEQLRTDNTLKSEFNLLKEMTAALKAKRKAGMKEELKTVWKQIKKDAPPIQTDAEGRVPESKKVDLVKLKNFALKTAAGLAAAGFLLSQVSGVMGNKSGALSKDKKEDKGKKGRKS